jgi:hypothetical protein
MKTSAKTPTTFFYLITFLAIAFDTNCLGQDTIITRNGDSIMGHIIEVSPTEVKYKKAGIADGPLYIEDKSGIARIHYKNGFKDIFPEVKPWQLPVAKVEEKAEPVNFKRKPVLEKRRGIYIYDNERLNENQLYRLLSSVHDAGIDRQVKMAKRSRGLQYVGFAAIPLTALSLFTYIAAKGVHSYGENNASEENGSKLLLGCAAISVGASCYFKINRKNRNAETVRLYKQKFE